MLSGRLLGEKCCSSGLMCCKSFVFEGCWRVQMAEACRLGHNVSTTTHYSDLIRTPLSRADAIAFSVPRHERAYLLCLTGFKLFSVVIHPMMRGG